MRAKLNIHQRVWIITLFVLIVSIMVGYAVMDHTLELNGTSKITATTLIRIMNIKHVDSNASGEGKIEGNIKGILPTEFSGNGSTSYQVTVKNEGSTSGILSTINLVNESNHKEPSCITMKIEGIQVGDILTPSQEQTFTVTVTNTCGGSGSKENEFSLSYIPVNGDGDTTTIDEQLSEIRNQITALQTQNEELQKEIAAASEYYNPKDLTNVYSPSALAEKVKNGDFSGLHIGDYFKVELPSSSPFTGCSGYYKNVNYIQIAGMDSYKNQGYPIEITKHHLVFVFKNIIELCPYNDTATNTDGYTSSKLKENVDQLTSIKATDGSGEDWYSYVLDHPRVVGEGTQSSTWSWRTEKLYLLQEVEVTGSVHFSNGYGNSVTFQLPLFAIYGNKEIVKRYNTTEYGGGSRYYWWLESPSASNPTYFTNVDYGGYASNGTATNTLGVVPAFLFGS